MFDPNALDIPLNQLSDDQFKSFYSDFMGEKGAIMTTRQGYTLSVGSQEPVEVKANGDITKGVVDTFVQSARGEIPTENSIPEACESTLTAIMGRMAYQQEREITWDEALNA